jgi:hypothetical protein
MKREIKFRAWDRVQRKWVSPGPTISYGNILEVCPVDSRTDLELILVSSTKRGKKYGRGIS